MSKGILIFAKDTEKRSYTKMAEFCARNISTHLKLPVTIVTDLDATVNQQLFDNVIRVDRETSTQKRNIANTGTEFWRNFNRHAAYNLSPYDETILMDSDFIVQSNRLLTLFELDHDFMCHKRRIYLGSENYTELESYGRDGDMWWATVVYFKKGPEAESVFTMMRMTQENYQHYANLYRFKADQFRNDYAISIALNTVYGHNIPSTVEIPWPLMNVEFTTGVQKISDIEYELKFKKNIDGNLKQYRIKTYAQDLHILNKDDLFEIINQ